MGEGERRICVESAVGEICWRFVEKSISGVQHECRDEILCDGRVGGVEGNEKSTEREYFVFLEENWLREEIEALMNGRPLNILDVIFSVYSPQHAPRLLIA